MSDVQGLDTTRAVFLIEATEILEKLEESLLELEESLDNIDLVVSVFRALHTIKSSGAMFGFDRVSAFTHEVETVFDEVRSAHMPVSRELIDLTLSSRDIIRGMLDADQGEGGVSDDEAQKVVAALKKLASPEWKMAQQVVQQLPDEEEASHTTWRILRGAVVPVADIRIKFGMTATAQTKNTCITVVTVKASADTDQMTVGALADQVMEVGDKLFGYAAGPRHGHRNSCPISSRHRQTWQGFFL